jgi:hypothetical protein
VQNADIDNAKAAVFRLRYRTEIYAAIAAQQEVGGLPAKLISIERAWHMCNESQRSSKVGG